MRLIDADKLLTKAQDYGEGQEKLILIDPYYVKKAETVQAIPIPDNATNGDVIKAMFPNANLGTLAQDDIIVNRNYSNNDDIQVSISIKWWNALYKRGNEDGSN